MKKRSPNPSERGQSLVLLVIMMVALLAILALALDGGMLFSNRRLAQNAADAGALAGARTYCLTRDNTQALAMANQYATVNNDATTSAASIQDSEVTVTTTIPYNTFFAHFVGRPVLTAQASAAAGCYNPTTGESVLPVAWICRPPIGSSDSTDCEEDRLTPAELEHHINNPPPPGTIYPELYIVMDSASLPDDLDTVCTSQGGYLNCDLDGDGDDDLIANGGRSWLDLDGGGGGSSELVSWVNGGFPGTIVEHTWVGGQSGVANNVFQAVGDHVGEIAALPVYDVFCDDYPDPRCSSLVDPGDIIINSAGGNYYYRIISFAAFYISCVNAPGVPGPECPGHRFAREVAGVLDANTKTIEGYFVEGFFSELGGGSGGGGVDTGAYTLYLIR